MNTRLAFVVTVSRKHKDTEGSEQYEAVDALTEIDLLAQSAGLRVVGHRHQRRMNKRTRTFFGAGVLEQIISEAINLGTEVILFDCELTPHQSRYIENTAGRTLEIMDRTQLILQIFVYHARSKEGKLQSQSAQLSYRLAWLKDLDFEKRGFRAGSEAILKTKRRRLVERLRSLRRQVDEIRAKRALQRRRRTTNNLETIVLVGYTNTGKSTLFNALTDASVATSGRMFETVDPTIRIIRLPSRRKALLIDTVGLIRDTPPALVSGFNASLEEVRFASLVLRVTDVSDSKAAQHERHVEGVIRQLHVESIPEIRVFNKIDLISSEALERLEVQMSTDVVSSAYVSARSRIGLNDLLERIDFKLQRDPLRHLLVKIPYSEVNVTFEISAAARIFRANYYDAYAEYDLQVPNSIAARLQPFVVEGEVT